MKKWIKVLLPGILFFVGFTILPSLLFAFIQGLGGGVWFHTTDGVKILMIQQVITFFISYLLTYLWTKNRKKFAYGFIILLLLAFSLPGLIEKEFWLNSGIYSLANTLKTMSLAIILCLGIDWFSKDRSQKILKRQNLKSELMLLKNQINPHFLFNTLNNIDSLIKSDPDCASKSLIDLSEIMRYMIYETNEEKVPLKKELDYIKNYLSLQQLQYSNSQLVDYQVLGDPAEIRVAPMLFISFIENAFKHCTDKDQPQAICISFQITDRQICFRSQNINNLHHSISKDTSSGVGLELVKRRLGIIYPGQHLLQINRKNDLFCVELTIDIRD